MGSSSAISSGDCMPGQKQALWTAASARSTVTTIDMTQIKPLNDVHRICLEQAATTALHARTGAAGVKSRMTKMGWLITDREANEALAAAAEAAGDDAPRD